MNESIEKKTEMLYFAWCVLDIGKTNQMSTSFADGLGSEIMYVA